MDDKEKAKIFAKGLAADFHVALAGRRASTSEVVNWALGVAQDHGKMIADLSFDAFKQIEAARTQPFVMSIHGIRTNAPWQKVLGEELQNAGFRHRALDYGIFRTIKFLWPGSRKRQIEWFLEQYRNTCREYFVERPSIVAHSFGTYLLAHAINRFSLKFDKIILCGSIVPEQFPWPTQQQHFTSVFHQYGGQDLPVRIAPYAVRDAGNSGRFGFTDPCTSMTQRKHLTFGHSDYFSRTNYATYWIPFLRGEDLPPQTETALSTNWRFAIAVGVLALAFGAAVWGFASRRSSPPPDAEGAVTSPK